MCLHKQIIPRHKYSQIKLQNIMDIWTGHGEAKDIHKLSQKEGEVEWDELTETVKKGMWKRTEK